MTAADRRDAARLLAGAHAAQATLLLAQPPGVLRGICGDSSGDRGVPPSWIMRVLGTRTLIQAAAEASSPTTTVLRLGAVVDVLHAVSMLAASRVWPRYRRAALVSACSAGSSAVAGLLLVRGRR